MIGGSFASYKTGSSLGQCATITHDSVSVPHIVTIDFGTSNCVGLDGRSRRGKVIVTYSGKYRDAGSTHTVTFDNFFVNDNQITGTRTVTNNGLNQAGNISFSIEINGSVILANGAGTCTHVSSRTREWVAGYATDDRSDDAYLITGNASGTNSRGGNYTAEILTPLRHENSCHNIVSGVIKFTPASKPARTIDFGNGTCDNQATVSAGSRSKVITLH